MDEYFEQFFIHGKKVLIEEKLLYCIVIVLWPRKFIGVHWLLNFVFLRKNWFNGYSIMFQQMLIYINNSCSYNQIAHNYLI
jgi:hypothetical protein